MLSLQTEKIIKLFLGHNYSVHPYLPKVDGKIARECVYVMSAGVKYLTNKFFIALACENNSIEEIKAVR